MNFEIKNKYIPSSDKRFEISSDVFSRERINAVKETYKILKNEIPFFAGITVYGSLSKGKKLDETNIDNLLSKVLVN